MRSFWVRGITISAVGAVQYGAKRLRPVFCVTLFYVTNLTESSNLPNGHSTIRPFEQLASWPLCPVGQLAWLTDYLLGLVDLVDRLATWPINQLAR